MTKLTLYIFLFLITQIWSLHSYAKGTYLEPEKFLSDVFNNNPPNPQKLWLKKDLKKEIKKILGDEFKPLRLRYWDDGSKKAWILERIGRDKPITTGYVTSKGKILDVKVLVFRESRGWEVRYPFFTEQFSDATLKADTKLDRKIDGISGATLSVDALIKLARLALFLDKHVDDKKN
ncbi:MAG: FMN-binding protein [Legionellales bacterium]|nr:FMN-binding protein [Legionellales bacterium]|tara:strand:+ start:239 stop:769 length:531 start_codon:yes stop_codon:yes gene_type:complete